MFGLVDQIKSASQLRWNKIHKFRCKLPINFSMGSYLVKTADTYDELIACFKLRNEVFNVEFRGLPHSIDQLDFDRFDFYFDHLIILHTESRKVIGTYRMSCSTYSSQSYTGEEFDLGFLAETPGPHLELGRACIHKSFRKGVVINLLWRGIAEYLKLSKSKLLFGCSSVKVNHAREAALIYKYLTLQKNVTSDFRTYPNPSYQMENFDAWFSYFREGLSEKQIKEAEDLVPSLVRSYLKLGAKVACEPAFDSEFDCIDLLTVLKPEDMSLAMAEKLKMLCSLN